MWLHSLKVAQLLRSAACLHTNQSRSYLNHLVSSYLSLGLASDSVHQVFPPKPCVRIVFSHVCHIASFVICSPPYNLARSTKIVKPLVTPLSAAPSYLIASRPVHSAQHTFLENVWTLFFSLIFIKVKVVRNRTFGLQEVEASRISRQSAHEGGKVVSPTHRPPLLSRRYPWYSFLL